MKQLLSIICIILMTSCTWVKDDRDDCPTGFWLQLNYSYNILDVDAAQKYLKDATVYIYDASGNYVKRIDVSQASLQANGQRVQVDGLPEGDYQFLVWSGANNTDYSLNGANDSIPAFRLSLDAKKESSKELSDLYYGMLEKIHYSGAYEVHPVSMMKNTNKLACLVVAPQSVKELKADDFSMTLVSANDTVDAYNKLRSSQAMTYKPYLQDVVTVHDADYGELKGVRFGLSTLRLMADTDCRLIMKKKSEDANIFNISLPECIGTLGTLHTQLGKTLDVQEYLDRQDFYTIIFFLSEDASALMEMKVNSWRVRNYNNLDLK